MKVFSTDILIAATAYVTAETEEEARALMKQSFHGTSLEVPDGYAGDGLEIHGSAFSHNMPEVSLSPAMTVHGFCGTDWTPLEEPATIEIVEDLGDDEEEGDD